MFDKDTVQHLRIPFSFFLMPVFLFSLSQALVINWTNALLSFFILHLLIFPSSNGYNSYQDRDETSIGGLKYPPKVSVNLYYSTLLLDATGIICGLFVSPFFSFLLLIFVLASRAYSYRNIRLKKYPFTGFFTVFFFQGAFVYLMTCSAIGNFALADFFKINNILCMGISSLFIGSIYPLTQIYQHQSDLKDGVVTISHKLGYTGTFLFSAILFFLAMILMNLYFTRANQPMAFIVFFLATIPVVCKWTYWFVMVRKSSGNANFENAMEMNLVTSLCMNVYFLLLLSNNFFNWF